MKCANPKCQKEFEPEKHNPHQKCCCHKCAIVWYNLRHKDQMKANSYYWRKRNREHIREYGKKYYEEHKEKLLLKQKIYDITGKWPRGKIK